MRVLSFYLRRSLSAVLVAAALGAVSGGATAALLAMVNRGLHVVGAPSRTWIGLFAGLCFVRFGSGVGAHLLLTRLSQQGIRDLRAVLSSQILGVPLRGLERLGTIACWRPLLKTLRKSPMWSSMCLICL